MYILSQKVHHKYINSPFKKHIGYNAALALNADERSNTLYTFRFFVEGREQTTHQLIIFVQNQHIKNSKTNNIFNI